MGTHALRIANGGKHFGAEPALTGIDLQIRTGEFLAVLGPSGSGKSTLLRICAGLDDLSSGTLTWSGDGSRPRTGVVFQQPLLMPWLSVADNVAFARRFTAQRSGFDADDAAKLITRFGLDHLAARYPDELSGGQAQRVAILRAVATRPQLLYRSGRLAPGAGTGTGRHRGARHPRCRRGVVAGAAHRAARRGPDPRGLDGRQ